MAEIKCNFYMKNGMIISGVANIESQEEYDEDLKEKEEHFKKVWLDGNRGMSSWGSTTIRSEDCIGYSFEIIEEFEKEEEDPILYPEVSVDDILKGAFFNG